jgi:hypothetical protein|nr:hypothetical protein Q903MT_gene3639 [Picea sitchensis]
MCNPKEEYKIEAWEVEEIEVYIEEEGQEVKLDLHAAITTRILSTLHMISLHLGGCSVTIAEQHAIPLKTTQT